MWRNGPDVVAPTSRSTWSLSGYTPSAVADVSANAATSWPLWVALNSGIGYAVTYPALVATLGLVLFSLWVVAIAVARPVDRAVRSTARDSHADAPSAAAIAI